MISIKIVPLISDLGKTPLSVPSIFKGVLGLLKHYGHMVFNKKLEMVTS